MSRVYFTWQEEEANKAGHGDEKHNLTDNDHDKFSDIPEDIAYWEGRGDEKDEIEVEKRLTEENNSETEYEHDRHERENLVKKINDENEAIYPSNYLEDEDDDMPYFGINEDEDENFLDDDF